MAQAIPKGFHSVTPGLVLHDAAKAIDFYKRAFGATEVMRLNSPDGKIGHAELKFGDSTIMLSDEFPGCGMSAPKSAGTTTVSLNLYVPNVDAAFQQAVNAGAKGDMPPADMFWGDRYSRVTDPFGHSWGIATHVKEVSEADLKKGMQEMYAQMKQKSHTAG